LFSGFVVVPMNEGFFWDPEVNQRLKVFSSFSPVVVRDIFAKYLTGFCHGGLSRKKERQKGYSQTVPQVRSFSEKDTYTMLLQNSETQGPLVLMV
jgi:hypothetical protein